jgi:hypothetical protein
MITNKRRKKSHIEIDLSGPQGNAFFILGTAKRLASQLDLDYTQIKAEMTSGDYENLIQTFDRYFGDFVIMYR